MSSPGPSIYSSTLAQPYASEAQANLAFGLYPTWRGAGLATRAVLLAMRLLAERASIDQALIRVDPSVVLGRAPRWNQAQRQGGGERR
jgi:hypothetical protein